MMTFVSLLTLRVFSSTCKPQGNVMAMMMMVMVVMMMKCLAASHASLKVRF